jgi:hypothetical protein
MVLGLPFNPLSLMVVAGFISGFGLVAIVLKLSSVGIVEKIFAVLGIISSMLCLVISVAVALDGDVIPGDYTFSMTDWGSLFIIGLYGLVVVAALSLGIRAVQIIWINSRGWSTWSNWKNPARVTVVIIALFHFIGSHFAGWVFVEVTLRGIA